MSLTKLAPAVLVAVTGLGLSGCATKQFVREQVAVVNTRVDGLEQRLGQTDAAVQRAQADAQAAGAAAQANSQRIDQLNARADSIEQRMMKPKRARN